MSLKLPTPTNAIIWLPTPGQRRVAFSEALAAVAYHLESAWNQNHREGVSMKDSKLIDEALLSLIRMPEVERTQETICAHLTLAATAAGIKLKGITELQLEHMKLNSNLARMSAQMGDQFTYRATLRLGPDLGGMELFASIETSDQSSTRFSCFGATAEQVLAQLGKVIEQRDRAAELHRKMNINPQGLQPREVRA